MIDVFLEFNLIKCVLKIKRDCEEPTNNIEHKEIYEIVQNRINTSTSDYVSLDNMAKKFIFLDLKFYNISQ